MALAALVAAVALSAAAGPEIVVTRDSGTLPSGCTPRETAELLVRFADAVNAADGKELRRVFASKQGDGLVWSAEPSFRWYGVNDVVVYALDDLVPYFTQRHRQNERWQVLGVSVGSGDTLIPATAAIQFAVRRGADDVPPGMSPFAAGKGMIDCTAQRIFVWSMGHDPDHDRPHCPLPEPWTPGNPVVACSQVGDGAGERSGPNARASTSDFRIVKRRARLPARCGPRAVAARVRSALTAFNAGRGPAFSRHFVPGRRAAMKRLAEQRYEAGVGWTATVLVAPLRRARSVEARYRLDLLVTVPGAPLRRATTAVTIDCRSGLIRRLVAPPS